MRDADLFEGTSHLLPGRLCLVDKRFKVESRGHVTAKGKIEQIKGAITGFEGVREITSLSRDGNPDPNVFIESKKDMNESESVSLGEFVKLEDNVLVVLFD